MKSSFILLFLMFFAGLSKSMAYDNAWAMLQKFKDANSGKEVCYSYKVYQVDAKSNNSVDSLGGKLYRFNGSYLDSNTYAISESANGYFFKIGFAEKNISVYDINLFRKKMGLPAETTNENIISVPDSLILKYGKIDVKTNEKGDYKVEIILSGGQYSSLYFEADSKTYRISKMRIENMERDRYDELTGYKKVYVMDNIKYSFDKAVFDCGRFYKITNHTVVLNNKYAKYKLNTLTK